MSTEGHVLTEDQPQVVEPADIAEEVVVAEEQPGEATPVETSSVEMTSDEAPIEPQAVEQHVLPAGESEPAVLQEAPKLEALPEVSLGAALAPAVEAPAEEVAVEAPVAEADATKSGVDLAVTTEAGVPWWPFVGYDIVWAAFAGVLAWRLSELPPDANVYSAPAYPVSIVIGVVLALAGPLVAVYAWRKSTPPQGSDRRGLFSSSLLLGAMATLLGVVLWWAGLSIGDYLRLSAIL